jgi:hypothetical protein
VNSLKSAAAAFVVDTATTVFVNAVASAEIDTASVSPLVAISAVAPSPRTVSDAVAELICDHPKSSHIQQCTQMSDTHTKRAYAALSTPLIHDTARDANLRRGF